MKEIEKNGLFVALVLLVLPISVASSQNKGLDSTGIVEIDDREMAGLFGRFRSGNRPIVYFGVSMASSWQNPAGTTAVDAGVTFALSNTGSKKNLTFQPTVSINSNSVVNYEILPDRQITSAGLSNATGIVQSTQVAGFGNKAQNTTVMRVLADIPSEYKGSIGLDESRMMHDKGITAGALMDDRGIGVVINVPGVANIQQQLGGLGANNLSSGVSQSIQLLTDGHIARNELVFDIVFGGSTIGSQLSEQLGVQLESLKRID